jgi:glycosyltransferase involved in cell wall biosynthesis
LNSGALPELIKDGVTGFLIDDLSPFKFTEKIKLAITCRNEIGSNASEFIRRNFSSHAIRKKWFDFLRFNLS